MCCCYVFLQRREDYSCPLAHKPGTLGQRTETYRRLADEYHWPGMYADVCKNVSKHVVSVRKLHVGGSSQPHFALFL